MARGGGLPSGQLLCKMRVPTTRLEECSWNRSRSAGWVRRSTGRAAATTRSTGSRSTRPRSTGLLDRPVEFVFHAENGLPQGSAKNATDGFRYLVDEGCIGVAGAYSSDNAITVGPLANELQIPLISWCGTERLQGDYCFRLGNGDCGGDATLVVAWLKRNGHDRVAVLSEISPNGEEYFRYFRQECRRRGISIAAVESVSQSPDEPRREPRQPAPGERGRPRLHGLRDARGEGSAARRARPAGLGSAADHGHLVHVLPDGLRQVRGMGGHRPARSEQPADRGVPRNDSSRATARTRRCGRTRSRCSRTTPPACSSKGCSARRSSRGRG